MAIEYFTEADKLEDVLGSFNLAKIFIYYNSEYQNKLDQSIKLLIDSFHQKFYHSRFLLCLALIKKAGFDLDNIKKELNQYKEDSCEIQNEITEIITKNHLFDISMYEKFDNFYCQTDFLYDTYMQIISSDELIKRKKDDSINDKRVNITSAFYEGFGLDI